MRRLLALFILLMSALSAMAQRNGVASFGAVDQHDFDSVDLSTLTPSFHIPLIPKSHGSSLVVDSPQSCQPLTVGSSTYTICGANSGNGTTLASFNFIPHALLGMTAVATQTTGGGCQNEAVTALQGMDGLSAYKIATTHLYYPSTCGATSATVTTTDGTGITATLSTASGQFPPTITAASTPSGWTSSSSTPAVVTDPFGNTITDNGFGSASPSFTDVLGAVTNLGANPPTFQYTDTNAHSQTISFVNGTASTFQPLDSACNGNQGHSVQPLSSISFPDGTSISITWDTHGTGIDGLVKSIQLRTGGTISYTYGTLSLGCTQGWAYGTLSRVSPDGTTSYSNSYTSGLTTATVKDPGQNKTIYKFIGDGSGSSTVLKNTLISSIYRYQNTGTVGSPVYALISNTSYCYNTLSCGSTAVTYPITQLDIYQYVGTNSTEMSHEVQTFDSYGNLTSDATTDWSTGVAGQTITKTTNFGSCGVTNTAIHNKPCSITTTNGSTQIAKKSFTYNANGAPLTSVDWISSSLSLTTNYTPNTNGNGTITAIQDPNGQTTTLGLSSNCNGLLPASTSTTVNSVVISTAKTWDCNGAVVTSTTDANTNEDDTTYDVMFRPLTHNDYLDNVTNYSYLVTNGTATGVKTTDPLGVVHYAYVDTVGRPAVTQTPQTTGGSNYDTVSTAYQFNGPDFQTQTSVPCVTTSLNSTCSTVALTALVNPVAGPTKSTDANSGTITTTLNTNDVSVTAGPKPSSDNAVKTVQTEVDGFGRTKSVCALETSGGTNCGQVMTGSGVLTSSSYSFATGSSTVTTTRGSQTHTTISDAIGRATSLALPETGSTARTMVYDTQTTQDACSPSGGRTSKGDLLKTNLPDGSNYVCYLYDGLHRMTDVGNSGSNHTVNPCRRFKYDSTANGNYTAPSGYPSSGANIVGRLMEASTDNCSTTKLTDEWFAYDKDGRMTDMWEYTPINSTYYHTSVVYNADGVVTTLNGYPFNGSTTNVTYGVDGEGRWNSATLSAGSTVIVPSSGVTYDAGSRPTQVSIGTGTDKDTYSYDNVGHMSQYQFFVGSNNQKGILTWNSIGSLGSLQIVDGFNTSNNQTCSFAYDDVARLIWDGCVGTQPTYTYDQYNNITKSGSFPFTPGYSSTNNHYTLAGVTYDGNGNLTTDTNADTYTWDLYGKMSTFNSGSANTYDAFGRLVGIASVSPANEVLFTPMGRMGTISNSTTAANAHIPLPGGGILNLDGAGGVYYNHLDWLGSARVQSVISTGVVADERNFAPFGEVYQSSNQDDPLLFAGMTTDIFKSGSTWGYLYDTPNREYQPSAGRWQTPDPANASWNAYAYPPDPNRQVDPSGLRGCDPSQDQACVTAQVDEDFLIASNLPVKRIEPRIFRRTPDNRISTIHLHGCPNGVTCSPIALAGLFGSEGYLSDDQIRGLGIMRASYTRRFSTGTANTAPLQGQDLEEAVYRAMEFSEMAPDVPMEASANMVDVERAAIAGHPGAVDTIRSISEDIMRQSQAEAVFNNMTTETGGGVDIPKGGGADFPLVIVDPFIGVQIELTAKKYIREFVNGVLDNWEVVGDFVNPAGPK